MIREAAPSEFATHFAFGTESNVVRLMNLPSEIVESPENVFNLTHSPPAVDHEHRQYCLGLGTLELVERRKPSQPTRSLSRLGSQKMLGLVDLRVRAKLTSSLMVAILCQRGIAAVAPHSKQHVAFPRSPLPVDRRHVHLLQGL